MRKLHLSHLNLIEKLINAPFYSLLMSQIELFRSGIFRLNTRRFGKVAELMIKELEKFNEGSKLAYDLHDHNADVRIEVKFSRALKAAKDTISPKSILTEISSAGDDTRLIRYSKWKHAEFDCNIQQVKKKEFDILFYGVFFLDRVVIFKVSSSRINKEISYCDKQHRGNVGEGQFHLNQSTFQYHLDRFRYKDLSYPELYRLFSKSHHKAT